jgi:hypothetical protein
MCKGRCIYIAIGAVDFLIFGLQCLVLWYTSGENEIFESAWFFHICVGLYSLISSVGMVHTWLRPRSFWELILLPFEFFVGIGLLIFLSYLPEESALASQNTQAVGVYLGTKVIISIFLGVGRMRSR